MKINNIDIKNFNAKLMERNISASSFEVFNFCEGFNPFWNFDNNYKMKKLHIKLDLICKDSNELEVIKSKITKELPSCSIKFSDINFEYKGFCIKEPDFEYVMKGNEILSVDFLVFCASNEKIEILNRVTNKTIVVDGTLRTPCVVEIIPSIDIIDLRIEGFSDDAITIKNLKQGQKTILNGEDSTITCNGINKFNDTDLWEFPRLIPGTNIIKFSRNNCDITVKYKSRWI